MRLYREVVSVGESNPEGPIRQRVLAAVELSLLLEKKARFDEAESLLLRTAEAVENVQSKGPGVTEPVVRRFIEFYESSTREREAAVWRSRLPTSAPAN